MTTLTMDRLKPCGISPRTISEEALENLAASIRRDPAFMALRPIIIDRQGVILGGNQRYKALHRLGFAEIPDTWVRIADDLTEAQKRRFILVDNSPTGMSGQWDNKILAAEWDLPELEALGFDVGELRLAKDAETGGGQTDPDHVPEPPEQPVTRPGDLWALGEHRLLCGDATRADDVRRVLAGETPPLMVTDPPYGVAYDPAWRNKATGAKSERVGKVLGDHRASWAQVYAHFPGDVAYVWHASAFGSIVERSLAVCGFEIRSQIIWVKQRFALSRGHYHWRHEACWYAVRKNGGGAHWQGGRKQQTVWADIVDRWVCGETLFVTQLNEEMLLAFDGRMTTVWEIGQAAEVKTVHGTQKPVECMARPIRNHDCPLVYEPFCGSGTTIIACEQLGRRCLAVELSPLYVDVAVRRWEQFTGKKAELLQ